jgi:protein-S-isoprenylcysteine O-methyltransferase Ste14
VTTQQKDKILVSIQFLLLGIYLIPVKAFTIPLPAWLSITGFWIGLTGCIPIVMAMIALNVNLSPFPTPKKSARLIQHGIFKFVRHPIYSGILLFCFGFSLYQANLFQWLVSFLLLTLFIYKAKYEEGLLQKKFNEYATYKKKTGMFLPRFT